MAIPARTLDELETEALVGRCWMIVAEGPTDATYLQQWLSELGWRVVPVSITNLDLSGITLTVEALTSNRQKVIEAARAFESSARIRFLIDLDLGMDEADLEIASLLVTDFPSIESYALSERVLSALLVHTDRIEYVSMQADVRSKELASAVRLLVEKLAGYLCPLFRLRKMHAEMADPDEFVEDLRKFRVSGTDVLDVEKVRLVLRLPEDPNLKVHPLPATCSELRPTAYGHDIARSIWALWPDLRTRNHIVDSDDLERLMLSFVRNDDLRTFALFTSIDAWAA